MSSWCASQWGIAWVTLAEAGTSYHITRNMRTLSLAAFLVAVLLAPLPVAAQADDDSLYWLDNYQAALKEAKATGKPIFLEYRCEP